LCVAVYMYGKLERKGFTNFHITQQDGEKMDTSWCSWLRHCATNRKVAGSIPDGLTGFVVELILLVALWIWGALSL